MRFRIIYDDFCEEYKVQKHDWLIGWENTGIYTDTVKQARNKIYNRYSKARNITIDELN